MSETEKKYIADLVAHTKESIEFFSDPNKQAREVITARAFLKLLSVEYREEELHQPTEEPVDIAVSGARFQVTELQDPGRRRHKELKEKVREYERAENLSQIMYPYESPRRIAYDELVQYVMSALALKKARYSLNDRRRLDVLVYVNLRNTAIAEQLEQMPVTPLQLDEWRSVSVLIGQHALVLSAREDAPFFLRAAVGQPAKVWPTPYGLFDD